MDSDAWDARYSTVERLWSAEPNLFLRDRLSPAQPGVGLDLAAGEGRNAVWLQSMGWQMTAVDFSQVAVERGLASSPDIEVIHADVLDWEPEKSYDLIVVAYQHLPEELLRPLIGRLGGWLNTGGEVFLIGHDRSNLEKGYGGPQVPEILWNVDEVLSWLGQLETIEASVVKRPVETDDGQVFARDTLVRARA